MRLFKYLAPQRTDVLKNQCIRFSQTKYLNDPFEWLPFVKRLMSEIAADSYYRNFVEPPIKEVADRKLTINDIPEEFRDKVPKEILDSVFDLTIRDGLNLLPQFHPENLTKLLLSGTSEQLNVNISEVLKNSWNKYFGILCLAQSNDSIPMWSHYAQNHEGFVLEFDPENEFFKESRTDNGLGRQLREVHYTQSRQEINLLDGIDNENDILNRIVEKILYTKSMHWSDEHEVRMIDKLSKHDQKIEFDDQEVYLFNFKPEAITAIYLGVNMSQETEHEINGLMRSPLFKHMKSLKGELDLREYKINFKEV